MLTIVINNLYELEVPDQDINYVMQVNDISELSSRQCNYTDSFSIPKTAQNVNIFNQLGYVGDISNYPYEKVTADLLDNGVHIIRNGWLDIQETNKEYKINIRYGSIDLFKAIENKTFGDDVDLSEIDHNKTLNTVVESFTNEDYRYIINDYGGKTHTENGTKINIDYLIPSVRISYLWNKIFSTFGFNYIGDIFSTTDFTDLWLTYPKGLKILDDFTLYADISKSNDETILFTGRLPFVDFNITEGFYSVDEKYYVIPEDGSYKIETNIFARRAKNFIFGSIEKDLNYIVYVNDNQQGYFTYGTDGLLLLTLKANDKISIGLDSISLPIVYSKDNNKSFVKVSKINSNVSFSEELKNLKITDFFKEILNIFSLTIFVDKDNNYIFKTFAERLEADVVDWSDKYKERTSETYVPKSYAQRNYFKEKYNDENANYNDGYFDISNKNLSERKDVINSIIYSAEKDFVSFLINSTSQQTVLPDLLWEKEITENSGVQEVRYKELSNRFYLIKNQIINKSCVLRSETLSIEQAVSSIPIARHNVTSYKDFVPKYYRDINLLLDSFRMHKVILDLDCIDIHNLDFDKIYYFEQEQNYYFLNKINYKNGKLSNGEFYRVRKTELVNCFISNLTSITYEADIICETPTISNVTLRTDSLYEIVGEWTSSVYLEYSENGTNYTRVSDTFEAGNTLSADIPLQQVDFFVRLVAVCDETKVSNAFEYDYQEPTCFPSTIDSIIFN